MKEEPAPNRSEGEGPLIGILGCYRNKGMRILETLAAFLRKQGINAWTSSELYATSRSASPKVRLEASRRTLQRAAGVLFVFLSHSTLQVSNESDIIGGMATEIGMMYLSERTGRMQYRATLYDGNRIIKLISSLTRGTGWGYEGVAKKGNLEHIRALANHLCRRLLEEIAGDQ